jgi:hypothetical protein
LGAEVDIGSAWGTIRENISTKESLGYYELLDQSKQARLQ